MGFFSFLNSKPSTPDYSGVIQGLNTAAQTSADRGVFKPVTVSTSFGTPQYTYDDQGRLTSAGYEAAPWLQQQQTYGQGLSGDLQQLTGQYMGYTQPLTSADATYGAGGKLFGLAGQALPTSYDVSGATQDYYNRMQEMVAPERERQLASTRQNLFNRGRQGLAVGATQAGGQLATNPEMAAYYNAVASQDLNLANQAEQRARANLQEDIATGTGLYRTGAGLFGTGADLQNAYLKNVTASQVPYGVSLQNLGTMEAMAQSPLTLGMEMGRPVTAGMQYGGNLLFDAAQAGAKLQAGQIDAETRAANTPTFLQSLAMGTMGSLAKAGTNYLTGGNLGSLFSGSNSAALGDLTSSGANMAGGINTGGFGMGSGGLFTPSYGPAMYSRYGAGNGII
jgi:hypothetical protein